MKPRSAITVKNSDLNGPIIASMLIGGSAQKKSGPDVPDAFGKVKPMAEQDAHWVLGFMSGTSCDGVDAGVIQTDGTKIFARGASRFEPFADAENKALLSLMQKVSAQGGTDGLEPEIQAAADIVTSAHLRCINGFSRDDLSDITLAGLHGQTVWHAPKKGQTLQIGDARRLAQRLGCPVVYDFRSADVAAGGEGAPLAPIYHAALFADLVAGGECLAIVNIGGVANITVLRPNVPPLAFDCGPGNALMDHIMQSTFGQAYDADGRWARKGAVDEGQLAQWMSDPFFQKLGPKSLDRSAFDPLLSLALAPVDHLRTFLEFTARGITHHCDLNGIKPDRLVVCGGGARNGFLLERLAQLSGRPVETASGHGLDGDFIEAEAFAFLAARVKHHLPTSFPTTTGVSAPMSGGRITPLR